MGNLAVIFARNLRMPARSDPRSRIGWQMCRRRGAPQGV